MALLFGAKIVRSGVVLAKWASPDCSTSWAKPWVCSMDLSTVSRSGVSVVCWECVLAQPLKNSTTEIETKLWISKNLIKVFWSFRVYAHVDYICWRIWSSILTTPVVSGKCMAAGSNDNTRRGQLAARACASRKFSVCFLQ